MNTLLPPASTPTPPPRVSGESRPAGSLSDYYFELAQQSMNKVDPISPVPISSPCALGGAQATTKELAGSPDWALDTRPDCELSYAEAAAKRAWQLRMIKAACQLQTEFERSQQGGKS